MTMDTVYQIDINVESHYVEAESDPESERYLFAYTVTIRNNGNIAAKLLTRHWKITDSEGRVQEVHGRGVVGEQPYLKPGENFRYTSSAMLETPVGSMEGSYHLIADDKTGFDAPIAPFSLAVPAVIH